jgi:hypothetical protein
LADGKGDIDLTSHRVEIVEAAIAKLLAGR